MSFLKKNSVQFALWILLGVLSLVLLGAAVSSQRKVNMGALKVNIDHGNGIHFINEENITQTVHAFAGDSFNHVEMSNLSLKELENILESNPLVRNAEVYSNITGNLIVKVEQRNPVLRVINKEGVSFYIDDNAQTMPLSTNFTARVPVASGNIDLTLSKTDSLQMIQKKQLFDLVSFVRSDPFWNAQTEQIYINDDGDFELIPKLEDHVFLLGNADKLEEKFRRMNIFYKEVLTNQKSDQFKIINVKYNNQIICSKN